MSLGPGGLRRGARPLLRNTLGLCRAAGGRAPCYRSRAWPTWPRRGVKEHSSRRHFSTHLRPETRILLFSVISSPSHTNDLENTRKISP